MSDAASITPARNHAEGMHHDNGSISEHGSMHSNDADEYYEKPPQKKRFYRQKKYWIICGVLSAIITLVVVLLIVFVFFPMIAQSIINHSGITVKSAAISFTPPASNTNQKRQDNTTPFVANGNDTFFMEVRASPPIMLVIFPMYLKLTFKYYIVYSYGFFLDGSRFNQYWPIPC